MTSNHNLALKYFMEGQYEDAFNEFLIKKLFYECGYCKFIQGDVEQAKNYWENATIDSPAINWGLNLIKITNLTIPRNLTFFQIRNFLERDLELLFKNHQLKMIENIMSADAILAEINPETYKFIGRVLLNNGYYDLAYNFLEKAEDVCYKDCEVHFLLAQYYILKNDKKEAIKTLHKSILITLIYSHKTQKGIGSN